MRVRNFTDAIMPFTNHGMPEREQTSEPPHSSRQHTVKLWSPQPLAKALSLLGNAASRKKG